MNGTSTFSISELRQQTAKAIHMVNKQKKSAVILQRSQPKAVLVDYEYYQALEEAVLDLTDSLEAERAKKEPREPFSSYVKRRWGSAKI